MNTSALDDELRELQRDYLSDVREKLALIRQHGSALGDGKRFKSSFPVLLFLAHQLKGSGGSLGFPKITDIAKQISEQLNRFLDDASPRPTPQELSNTLVGLTEELESVLNESEKSL